MQWDAVRCSRAANNAVYNAALRIRHPERQMYCGFRADHPINRIEELLPWNFAAELDGQKSHTEAKSTAFNLTKTSCNRRLRQGNRKRPLTASRERIELQSWFAPNVEAVE